MNIRSTSCLLLLMLTVTACASKEIYDWGSYENSIYGMYSKAETYNVDQDVSVLITEIQRSVQNNKKVPPGKSAHVAYLLYLKGDKERSMEFFEEEKRSFPESAPFIDGMVKRLK